MRAIISEFLDSLIPESRIANSFLQPRIPNILSFYPEGARRSPALRSESFRISQENLNTASARGAADSIASRIPPGLGLASGVLAIWCLLGLVGLVGLARLAGLVCLVV